MKRIWNLWALLSLTTMLLAESDAIDGQLKQKIDNFVEKLYMPISQIHGVGLAINSGDDSYTRGYGFASKEEHTPVANHHRFLVGSISKTFTSLALVKILSESFPDLGESALDTPIAKLIPSADFLLIDRYRTQHATFRDLLSHRLCIATEDLPIVADAFSTAELVYRQRYAEEVCGFRSRFTYSNQIALVASSLIGSLANQSFESYTRSMLDDIGLTESGFIHPDDTAQQLNLASPYYTRRQKIFPMNFELLKRSIKMQGAAGLYMSINDMQTFMQFFASSGYINGKQVISQDALNWMKVPVTAIHYANDDLQSGNSENSIVFTDFTYGLGLFVGSYNGFTVYSHSGYFSPYQSLWSFYPALNLSIFSSSNYAPGLVDPKFLHAFIFAVIQGSRKTPELDVSKAMENDVSKWLKMRERHDGQIRNIFISHQNKFSSSSKLKNAVGKYSSKISGIAEISLLQNPERAQNELYLRYGKWVHGWLVSNPTSTAYKIEWTTDFVQDQYAKGNEHGFGIAVIENEILEIFFVTGTGFQLSMGKFTKDLDSEEQLPAIPWILSSCE